MKQKQQPGDKKFRRGQYGKTAKKGAKVGKPPRSLSNQIRDLLRLLKRPDLDPKMRDRLEAKLEELRAAQTEQQQKELERKYAIRYHKVRFFERVKLERRLQRLQAQLAVARSAQGPEAGGNAAAACAQLRQQVEAVQEDLQYVLHFPKAEKYVSLLKQADDPVAQEKLEAERARLRAMVKRQLVEAAMLAEADEGAALAKGAAEMGGSGGNGGAEGPQHKTAAAAAGGSDDEQDDFFLGSDEEGELGEQAEAEQRAAAASGTAVAAKAAAPATAGRQAGPVACKRSRQELSGSDDVAGSSDGEEDEEESSEVEQSDGSSGGGDSDSSNREEVDEGASDYKEKQREQGSKGEHAAPEVVRQRQVQRQLGEKGQQHRQQKKQQQLQHKLNSSSEPQNNQKPGRQQQQGGKPWKQQREGKQQQQQPRDSKGGPARKHAAKPAAQAPKQPLRTRAEGGRKRRKK